MREILIGKDVGENDDDNDGGVDDESDVKEKWGLGYDNPYYLKKAIRKQPALYNFDFLYEAGKYPHFKPKFVTKSPDEVEAKEDENRKNTKKMQLSFCYQKLNDSYLSEKPKFLSNDYFACYSTQELEAKPIKAKIFVPPLVLESKIIDLENALSDERILVDIQQLVFSTVMKNTVFKTESEECSTSSKAPHTSEDDFDDLFEKGKKQKKWRSQKRTNTGKLKKRQTQKSVFPNKSKSFVSVLKKKRSEERTEWRPKQKVDETAKSCPVNVCNRPTGSIYDVIGTVASTKQNLVIPYKKYTIKQLLQLSRSATKSSKCRRNDFVSRQYSDDWFEKFCENVRFGNDQFSPILGYGDVIQDNVTITKVSYVESLGHNMFNIGQCCDKDLEVNFKAKRCSVRTEDGKELLVGTRKSNLYTINLSKVQIDNEYEKEHLCPTCEKGKMKRVAHKPKPEPSTSSPLELLHMDLCGPMRTQSINDKKYVLVIVDDYSRMPEQNGVVERRNRTLVEVVRTMLIQSDLPMFLWLASEHDGSEPVLTGVLASGQISPEPVVNAPNSDKPSTSTSHLSELDLLFEFSHDEFLGSKLPKSVVIDRPEESSSHHPITSDVSTEFVPPVQQETPIQTSTPSVEDVHETAETEVVDSVGCTVMPNHNQIMLYQLKLLHRILQLNPSLNKKKKVDT
ncbi:hypothetical protein L6452_09779 [Arctium lappa]|uniref:Uncharacterized protein n=1 Tax=Arctium lappa TaxID=4217 RepID=A0ACB9DLM8_ARCLA|nr:hypothetical protein L6452_09779 [Arctium lappa]